MPPTSGPLDLLVNNAAVTRFGSVEETPLDDSQQMLDTNFLGPIRCMRAVPPGMRERGSGCIINLSTVAVPAAFAGTAAYAASKAALQHATAVPRDRRTTAWSWSLAGSASP
jgi:NAD(P)-dependent dehydrogenase (short-subunit alcohol dehydrogenase family)